VKAKAERIENSQVVLEVEAEPEEVERSLEEAYRHLVKRANVPGFRKGKAPRAMLEHYIGREALLEEALDHLVPRLLSQAIEEEGIEVIAQPEVEITQNDPVIFKATVPISPTVELEDYRSLRIAPEAVDVGEEEIEKVIEQLRSQHALWEPVERAVEFGDLVNIDIKASLDGESILDREDFQYNVIQGFPFPVPGFAEKLEGMEKGESRAFDISFPDDYETSELAGKDYRFEVALRETKGEKLPELDDEFAKSIGEGLETLDALHERVASNLRAIAEERARRSYEEKVVAAVVELAKVEFPPVLVEREVDRIIGEYERGFRERRVSLEEHLRSTMKTTEEFREELRPVAAKRVTESFVLGKVAEEEEIEVGDADIDEEVESMAQDAGESGEEVRRVFNTPQARHALSDVLLTRKTLKRMVEIASGGESEEMLRREEDGNST